MTTLEAVRGIVYDMDFWQEMLDAARENVTVNCENADADPESIAVWMAAPRREQEEAVRLFLQEAGL